MKQDDIAVGGDVAVGLEIHRSGRTARGEGGQGILRDVLGVPRNESSVGEDAGLRLTEEPRMRHDVGVVPPAPVSALFVRLSPPPKAVLKELRAFVNSLGMIQSLLDALSLIFGRVCRYW